MSASWVPESMANALRRRLAAREACAVELFRRDENPDDSLELLKALTEMRSLRQILSDLFDGLNEADMAQ